MNSVLDNAEIKVKCQKFTPSEYVNIMLDLAGYKSDLCGKKILESSFGSGNILKIIVERYIRDCKGKELSSQAISRGLERDIVGIELDPILFESCKKDLDGIVKSYSLPDVSWNLHNGDALFQKFGIQFDFIIGNPPYVAYAELQATTRNSIKEAYETCSLGKFDYCYAFIEMGIMHLTPRGRMVQLVPSNIYKNVFASKLRKMLKDHVAVIFDYPAQKIFKDALTSSSIFLYDKSNTKKFFYYENKTVGSRAKISKNTLSEKWEFRKREKNNLKSQIRFGDLFNVSMVVATLLNRAFIIESGELDSISIEPEMVRKAVSPRSIRYKKNEYIIFPYLYEKGRLVRFCSEEFEARYPLTSQYLKAYLKDLKKRKSDKSVQWFEYGRTQALTHLNQEKILLSTIVTSKVEFTRLAKDIIPYSGMYIIPKSENSLACAEKILTSIQFEKYVRDIGISVSGRSVRITSKDISNFKFVRGELTWNS